MLSLVYQAVPVVAGERVVYQFDSSVLYVTSPDAPPPMVTSPPSNVPINAAYTATTDAIDITVSRVNAKRLFRDFFS